MEKEGHQKLLPTSKIDTFLTCTRTSIIKHSESWQNPEEI